LLSALSVPPTIRGLSNFVRSYAAIYEQYSTARLWGRPGAAGPSSGGLYRRRTGPGFRAGWWRHASVPRRSRSQVLPAWTLLPATAAGRRISRWRIYAKAMENGAGSVEGQFPVAIDSDDLVDELRSLRDPYRRPEAPPWGEEFARWLSGLGFWHRETLAKVGAAFQGSMDFSSL
jgi:hypothetical protein